MALLDKHFAFSVAKDVADNEYRKATHAAGYEWDPQKRAAAFMAADMAFKDAVMAALAKFYGEDGP